MFKSLNTTQKGMVWALLGYSAFALSDTCAKFLTAEYSFWQIICLDTGLAAVFMIALSPILCPDKNILKIHRPRIHMFRAVLNFLISILFVLSLSKLSLTLAYTLVFAKPFFVAVLVIFIYQEKPHLHRILAIFIGFSGIVIAMRPGMQAFDPWFFLPLLAAFVIALMFVISRSLEGESNFALGFYPAAGTFILSLPMMAATFQTPTLPDFLLFAGSGAGITAGLIGLSLAFRMAPGGAIAPFHYVQMIWGIVLGYLIFGDVPDLWTLAGAAIIIASGLYLLQYERKIPEKLTGNTP